MAILHRDSLKIKYKTNDVKSNDQTFSTCSALKFTKNLIHTYLEAFQKALKETRGKKR